MFVFKIFRGVDKVNANTIKLRKQDQRKQLENEVEIQTEGRRHFLPTVTMWLMPNHWDT